MRAIFAAASAAGLMLAGCSEQTQESAGEMVESAADDAARHVEDAVTAAEDAAEGLVRDTDRDAAEAEAERRDETTGAAEY